MSGRDSSFDDQDRSREAAEALRSSARTAPIPTGTVTYVVALVICGVTAAMGGGFLSCSGDRPPGSPTGQFCSLTGLAYPGSGNWWLYALTPAVLFIGLTRTSQRLRRREGTAATILAGGTMILTLLLCLAIGAAQRSFLER